MDEMEQTGTLLPNIDDDQIDSDSGSAGFRATVTRGTAFTAADMTQYGEWASDEDFG